MSCVMKSMRSWKLWTVTYTFLAMSAPAFAVDMTELEAQWLTTDSIQGSDMSRLGELAKPDAEATQLLADAMQFLKVQNYDGLAKYFKICPAEYTKSGETATGWSYTRTPRTVDQIQAHQPVNYTPAANEVVLKIEDFVEDYRITKLFLTEEDETTKVEKEKKFICIKSGMNVLDSYGTVLHELTHLIRKKYDQLKTASEFQGPTVRDVALEMVLEPGSEVDAYLFETRAMIKLVGSNARTRGLFRSYFDDSANFSGDRETIGKIVLGTYRPKGAGTETLDYLSNNSSVYSKGLSKELIQTIQAMEYLEKLRTSMSDNGDVYEKNGETEKAAVAKTGVAHYTERLRELTKKVDVLVQKIKAYNADPDASAALKVDISYTRYD